MADLELPNEQKIHAELAGIQDAYRAETRLYIRYIESHALDLISGFAPYVESLKNGFVDALGETHEFSASAWNKRVLAAKHRIMYAFKRSPFAGDFTKQAQLKAHLDSAPKKKTQRGPITSEKYLQWSEVETLIAGSRERDRKLAPMIEFFARTGVRVSELIGIRLTDIKINGRTASVRIRGKGGVERTNSLDKTFIQSVIVFYGGTEFLFEHSGKPYSPRSITNRIKIVSEIILGKQVSSHGLRHSYARYQIVDLHRSAKAVANQLGHTSTAITMDFYVEDEPTGDPMMLSMLPDVSEDEDRMGGAR